MNDLLIEDEQEDFLKKVTVRIQVEINRPETILIGTGVIYFLDKGEKSVIITAKHCLLGNDFEHSLENIIKLIIQYKYLNNDSFSELEIHKENIIINEENSNDIALIIVSNQKLYNLLTIDSTKIPKIKLSKDFKSTKYNSNGYPNAFIFTDSYHFIDFKYLSNQGIQFEINSLSPFSPGTGDNAITAIEGYSGSGLFINNLNYLTGIITNLKSITGQFDTAICLKIENITNFINLHNLDSSDFQLHSVPTFKKNEDGNRFINKNLFDSIASLKGNISITENININDEYDELSYPQVGQKFAKRQKLVDKILIEFQHKVWLHFYRTIGYGKTQFANLIARSFNGKVLWIKIRDSSNPINTIFYSITKEQIWNKTKEVLLQDLQENLIKYKLLVFDDLPRLASNEITILFFSKILEFCSINGCRIISTSNFPINNRLKELLNNSEFEEALQPKLNSDEILEVLLNHQVTLENIEHYKGIIEIQSQGHPFIVNEIISFLKQKNWQADINDIKQIFNYNFSPGLTEEIQVDITNTIHDRDTRELLYRLNVIQGTFTIDEVKIVANIEPTLERPLEKLNSIKDLWIQVEADNVFSVSPLLRQLKTINLSDELTSRLNNKLAEKILMNNNLNHLTIYYAINYLISAENYNEAAIVLINILQKYKNHPEQFYKSLISYFWYDMNLPKRIYVEHRINIRILQIQISIDTKRNSETLFLLQDLENIVAEASILGIKITYAKFLLSILYSDVDNRKSNEYLLNSVEEFSKSEYKEYSKDLKVPKSLIWIPLSYSESLKEVINWLNT